MRKKKRGRRACKDEGRETGLEICAMKCQRGRERGGLNCSCPWTYNSRHIKQLGKSLGKVSMYICAFPRAKSGWFSQVLQPFLIC